MTRRALAELDGIVARTAAMNGSITQFEIPGLSNTLDSEVFGPLLQLQEDMVEVLGMVQRICMILIEENLK